MATDDPVLHALIDLCELVGKLPSTAGGQELNMAYHNAVEVIRDHTAPGGERSRYVSSDAQDAKRYRYLRDTPPWKSDLAIVLSDTVKDDVNYICQEALDVMIDEARSSISGG